LQEDVSIDSNILQYSQRNRGQLSQAEGCFTQPWESLLCFLGNRQGIVHGLSHMYDICMPFCRFY